MRNTSIIASTLLAFLLSGCAGDAQQSPLSAIQPFTRVSSDADGSAWYQIGRHYHEQEQYARAEQAFRKALLIESGNAEAYNALGATLAAQGRLEEATDAFRIATQAAPTAAHIRSNLGRIYLLRGMHAEAEANLRQALLLPDASQHVRDNLAEALAVAQQRPQSGTPAAQPSTPQIPSALALQEPSSKISVIASNASTVRVVTPTLLPIDLSVVENATTIDVPTQAIVSVPARPPAAPTVKLIESVTNATPAVENEDRRFRLEVANGNGINGMARRVSVALKTHGYFRTRLTNQKPFTQAKTQILYRNGFEKQAETIGQGFKQAVTVSERSNIDPRADVRVILGHDLPRDFAFDFGRTPARFLLAAAIPTQR